MNTKITKKQKENIMKNDQTYNGWTNYATWRINLEVFDGMHSDIDGEKVTAESCKDYAEEVVSENGEGLALDYAMAFMANVNWHEIAGHLNEE
jgi:hypothetical protein